MEDQLGVFEANRGRLFGLAYRMLGEAAEAEDVVQESYLRWARSGPVEVPAAWLTKVVTNLCLTHLTSARARRERYVGPWLPEPVLTEGDPLGPLETVEQRDSVSVGVLMLLERLTPPERAAFVLREAFGYTHAEIAEVLDANEARVRQLYRRARQHLRQDRQRFEADPERGAEIVQRFLAAALEGDVDGLERLLATDAGAWADGGGKGAASRVPVFGADRVAALLARLLGSRLAAGMEFEVRQVNGGPAIVVWQEGGTLAAVSCCEVVGDRLTAVRTVVNPDKLAFVSSQLT
ncbi:RNA polymerase sigma-70 factor [Streptomyces sp. AJS327]|uniref:RNA polymerase sigma-70 factor n=1 Tax=Streptomyces sp. AJS327 TaxID=2545265 RepID=UPI0015DD8F43|nr:RNA polymerase sigma-70 factor [Streptomyces sp. AJS327]MBA0052856.1 RNA polymerase sigma-70 factor [Streptomyces sp. AJS327]